MNTFVSTPSMPLRLPASLPSRIAAAGARLRRLVRDWAARDRARRELAGLDDATLRDIGLSRGDADFIAGKPFWRE